MAADNHDPASAGAVAQVFVEDLSSCAVSAEAAHHLARVLRLKPGEPVVASDGAGSWRLCGFSGSDPWLEPLGDIVAVTRASPEITVAFTPVKGDRPEWVVQKLVEIGVDRIVVLRSERSVVVWEGHRGDRAIQRLEKTAEQAAAQSRRAWIPEVSGVTAISEFAGAQPVLFAERGGGRPELGKALCIGPEGGWTEGELALASGTVGLGHGVLRAETAAVVGGALVCALRDGDFSL